MAHNQGSLLIVDDEDLIRKVLCEILSDEGYVVRDASSAHHILEQIEVEPVDLVLLDVMMPEVTGLDALAEIRTKYTPSELPVIMVTAIGESEDMVDALEAGANDYVTKPVDMPVILARIRSQISRKRAEEALKHMHDELEERVESRTAELRTVNDKLRREMNERQELEEQFRQSQKMEAFGKLAGGVAHDFNNILTVINGYSQLLMTRIDREDSIYPWAAEVHRSGERAVALTRQLLAFSRRQVLQPQILDLNTCVVDMEKMLRRLIGEDIELLVTLSSDLDSLKADPGQLEQVMMNLAVNARDAMPKGGELKIETKRAKLSDALATRLEVTPGNYLALAVSDTGCGMDESIMAQVFEPFFTTKEEGKGTGLGLSTVFGIVKQSSGAIDIESEEGKGSCFTVYLPAMTDENQESEDEGESIEAMRGDETILLVEDEDTVRKLAIDVLTNCGYTVLSASSGDDAMDFCEDYDGSVDLLLTDVVMPGINGRELATKLSTKFPNMSVLYMSGYAENAIVKDGVVDPDIYFIDKPFEPEDLAIKIREILDESVKMGTQP